ncbi:MAG TPA: D-alanyl-D-alanine carboxypeptidase/D-alanyl-D-alanine-endopeptidase [Gemmatimonadales bacterium]
MVACLSLGGQLAAQSTPQVPPTLHDQLNAWFRRAARVAPGEWGVAIADERGQLLWGVNPTQPLIPASTVKLFTTGFARTVLGAEARQVTRVVGTGYVYPVDGTWVGTWALELNGDPTLERPSRQGPTLRDLALQLAVHGIRRLPGPLVVQTAAGSVDPSYPTAWSPKHRGRSFAPLIGALTLNENLISFTLAPGAKVGHAPRLVGSSPDGLGSLVTIKARTVQGRRDRLRVLAAGSGRYEVQGTIGVRARPRYFTATAQNLQVVLEAAWEAALARAGIEWLRGEGIGASSGSHGQLTLAEVVSPPLDSIAAEVNSRSLNIGAEALLRWAGGGGGGGGGGDSNDAARQLTQHVLQVTGELDGVYLVDGSGLSADDRATAYSFVKYLARFPSTPGGRNFPLLLPANGNGTLWRLGNSRLSPGVVRAKTGTLGNVSSLVGYLGHRDGLLLVSVLYNGGRVYAAKQQQWQLFRVLGAQGNAVPGDSAANDGQALGGESREPPGNPNDD